MLMLSVLLLVFHQAYEGTYFNYWCLGIALLTILADIKYNWKQIQVIDIFFEMDTMPIDQICMKLHHLALLTLYLQLGMESTMIYRIIN